MLFNLAIFQHNERRNSFGKTKRVWVKTKASRW